MARYVSEIGVIFIDGRYEIKPHNYDSDSDTKP